jgi:hypothetical protein
MMVRSRNIWCRRLAWRVCRDRVFIAIRRMGRGRCVLRSARGRRLWMRQGGGWGSWGRGCADERGIRDFRLEAIDASHRFDECNGDVARLFRPARVVGDQHEHLGTWFPSQNHLDCVVGLHSDGRLSIRRMISGNNTLTIQKHLEAAYFVLA